MQEDAKKTENESGKDFFLENASTPGLSETVLLPKALSSVNETIVIAKSIVNDNDNYCC